jgi:tetratricopeptide (TPR) repeat protein
MSVGFGPTFRGINPARGVGRMKFFLVSLAIVSCLFLPGGARAQITSPSLPATGPYFGGLSVGTENLFVYADVEIDVQGPKGVPLEGPVVVSLIKLNGQVYYQTTVRNGIARFHNVPKSELTAQVVAPGYQTAKKGFEILDRAEVKVKIDLQPMSDKEEAAADRGIAALTPKTQKEVGKALEALRANRPADAKTHLESAERAAPNSAEVEYLFGVYASQLNNQPQALAYWMKALELNPKHLRALLAVSQGLLQERQASEAVPYLSRALDTEPSSWRAHMLMAQACLLQGMHDDAVKQAERAMELGHERAASVQPLLARALFENGEKERAIHILQDYLQAHATDANAAKLLERLKHPPAAVAPGDAAAGEMTEAMSAATAMPVPSNWLPPEVDEKVPPVEPGAACSLDEVLQKTGIQIAEFVHNVDRFAATESLTHESINKYGIAAAPERRKFDYVVSIQEMRRGYLGVTEYRNGGGAQAEFPDGVVTNGLPALVLIFHPYYAPNYEMTCEGLTRWNGGLAWQLHFRQLPGKPNTIKNYQIGVNGPSYSVALKGRAWISADTYQIVRMETDLLGPVPQIRLLAEHTAIEYGPVKFHEGNVNMWLPQTADVYFAWRGRQVHRTHSFSHYLLFAVDDKQRISVPKVVEPRPDADPGNASP